MSHSRVLEQYPEPSRRIKRQERCTKVPERRAAHVVPVQTRLCSSEGSPMPVGRCPIQVDLLLFSWEDSTKKTHLAQMVSAWHTKMIYPDWRLMHHETFRTCLWQTMCPSRWEADWRMKHGRTFLTCFWQTMCPMCVYCHTQRQKCTQTVAWTHFSSCREPKIRWTYEKIFQCIFHYCCKRELLSIWEDGHLA